MIFLKIILSLGWLVEARYCRSLCRCLVVLRRYEIRKFGWRLFGHSYMIVWLTTYILLHRSTLPTLHRMMTSSGCLVDLVFHAVGRRASSYFLGLAAHEPRPPPCRWHYSGRPRFCCHVSIPPAVIQRRHAIRL